MRLTWIFTACILAGALLTPIVSAQEPASAPIIQFEVETESTFVTLPMVGGSASTHVEFIVHDRSIDSPNSLQDAVTAPNTIFHTVSFDFQHEAQQGWGIREPTQSTATKAGQSAPFSFQVSVTAQADSTFFRIPLNITMSSRGESETHRITFLAYTPGVDTFSSTIPIHLNQIEPEQIKSTTLVIRNDALLPRHFEVEVVQNPCGMDIEVPGTVLVPAKAAEEFTITARGPIDRFWYFSESCTLRLDVIPLDNPDQRQGVVLGAIVNGGYLDPQVVFWLLAALVAVAFLLLFLKRRKEAVEEEILGKPQKPWTIPVERVYLEHLEEADERAAYVVRHFLMEEEYQSALLWYKSYKKATKGQRSKERVVVGQERRYERFQKQWEKRIAAPIKTADRFEAKLQKKLDRTAKKAVRKDRRTWKKLVAKIEAAHEKKKAREMGKWEKAANKAQKKGQEAPLRPEIPAPEYPPEPEWQRIELADHKWQKKADRFRRKMIKRQGNLEVKYEKKEARLLAKLQRKVRRIARKIDDPDFEKDHPILGGAET